MANESQYADFTGVQDRLVTVMKKIASVDEAAYSEAARALSIPEQQKELDDLAELYQGSLKIRDYYFQQSTDSVVATISRGTSMLGRYWGFDDMSAASAIAALSAAVQGPEQRLASVEEYVGRPATVGSWVANGLPGGDPLEVGREEQKRDLAGTFGSLVPWLVVALVVLFLARKYL